LRLSLTFTTASTICTGDWWSLRGFEQRQRVLRVPARPGMEEFLAGHGCQAGPAVTSRTSTPTATGILISLMNVILVKAFAAYLINSDDAGWAAVDVA
jgi:hypothetical protein